MPLELLLLARVRDGAPSVAIEGETGVERAGRASAADEEGDEPREAHMLVDGVAIFVAGVEGVDVAEVRGAK